MGSRKRGRALSALTEALDAPFFDPASSGAWLCFANRTSAVAKSTDIAVSSTIIAADVDIDGNGRCNRRSGGGRLEALDLVERFAQ
jgi:hypothetical protein